MKQKKIKFLFIVFVSIISIPTFAQKGTRVGYIDMNIILKNIDEYNKASTLLDKNIEKWKKEIELKKIQLNQYEKQLNTERILLTPELINDRELEIKDFASERLMFDSLPVNINVLLFNGPPTLGFSMSFTSSNSSKFFNTFKFASLLKKFLIEFI